MFASTPKPPYYAVIFTSLLSEKTEGYEEMANRMLALAKEQTGFLGVESAREGLGITVSYWQDLEAIKHWKANSEHLLAQHYGKTKWYGAYRTRICKVEHEYGLEK